MQVDSGIPQYMEVVKRRKYHFIIPAVLVFFLVATVAFLLPPVYKSVATIQVESEDIPQDLVRTTVTGYLEERLQAISRIALSQSKLIEIIDRFGLYQDLRDEYSMEEIAAKMREMILIEPVQTRVLNPTGRPGYVTVSFTLSYESTEPEKMAQTVEALASFYLEENYRYREEKAEATVKFLENQLNEVRAEILDIEARLAAYKQKHMGELPELMDINLKTMERLQGEIEVQEERIMSLNTTKTYLESQLELMDPTVQKVSLDGKRILTPKEELEVLRSQYLSLSASVSEQHPDVISLKKKLAALESEINSGDNLLQHQKELQDKETQLAVLTRTYSEQHPDVLRLKREVARLKADIKGLSNKQIVLKYQNDKPENPAYINLESRITTTQMEIDASKRELDRLKDRYEEYRRRVENTPQVEQGYQELQRKYSNAKEKYQATTNRLLAAQEAKGLEEGRMAEKFTLLDPPTVPKKPYKPNRPALLLLGIVLAAGSGIGFGSVAEYLDQSVHQADELTRISGFSVLAVIPYMETSRDLAKRRRRRLTFVGSTVGLILIGLTLTVLHFLRTP